MRLYSAWRAEVFVMDAARHRVALGIVTRMGGSTKLFRREAIEPGPEGKRPDEKNICHGCGHACRTDLAGCHDRKLDLKEN